MEIVLIVALVDVMEKGDLDIHMVILVVVFILMDLVVVVVQAPSV